MKNPKTICNNLSVFTSRIFSSRLHGAVAVGALLALGQVVCCSSAQAAPVTLTASDTSPNSSFNAAGNWSNAVAPGAGNSYFVIGDTLLTPHTNVNTTFGGDSLTIGDGSTAGSVLGLNGIGNYAATPATSVYTINNLSLNDGTITAITSNNEVTGNTLTLLSGGGTIDQNGNQTIDIGSVITGSGTLDLTNSGAAASTGQIILAVANTYTGATTIEANTRVKSGKAFGNSSSVTLVGSGAFWNFASGTATVNNLSGVAGTTIDSQISLGGSTLTINETTNGTFAGNIINSATGGTFHLTKIGSGTLTLSGTNTYNGNTLVGNGVLDLDGSTGSILGTSALNLFGGTFLYDNTNSAAVAKSQNFGANAASLGDNTIQTIKGGASSAALTLASLTARSQGATRNFIVTGGTNGSTNGIYVTTATAGMLSAGDFFNGSSYAYVDTTGSTPFVRAAVYGTDATFVISNAGATMTNNATNNYQVNSSITGQAAASENTIQFTGTSENDLTLTGNLTLSGGLLRSGGGATVISGAAIAVTGSTGLVFRTDSAADSLTINSVVGAGSASTSNSLTKSGAGTLTLGASNTYLGNTYIDGGVLSVSKDANLGNAAQANTQVIINNGTLEATATFGLYNVTAGAENRGVEIGNTGTIDVTGTNTLTVAGAITNQNSSIPGTLVKTDTGTLALTGANTYTGGTIVQGGNLNVNNTAAGSSATGTGAVDVQTGATISGGNNTGATTSNGSATLGVYAANVQGMIGGALTIESGGHLAAGNGGVGTITTASLTLTSGSILDYEFNNTANDFTAVTGALTLNGGSFNLYQEGTVTAFDKVGIYDIMSYSSLNGAGIGSLSVANEQAGFNYTFIDDTADDLIQLDITAAVPEPSTWMLLLGGGVVLACYQFRRRQIGV